MWIVSCPQKYEILHEEIIKNLALLAQRREFVVFQLGGNDIRWLEGRNEVCQCLCTPRAEQTHVEIKRKYLGQNDV